jgi:hypothetical protein
LDKHANRIPATLLIEDSGTRTDAAFEFVANHAGAAANIAFFNGAGVRHIKSVPGILGFHMESVDVVEVAVPGFGDNGQGPPVAFHIGGAMLNFPGDDRIAHHADAVGIGDHDGAIEESGIVDPGRASHFAIAVQCEPGGEYGIIARLAARVDGRDSGADWAFADLELAFAGDQGSVAHFDAFDVGNGVIGTGCAVEGSSEVAGSWLGLSGQSEDQSAYDDT